MSENKALKPGEPRVSTVRLLVGVQAHTTYGMHTMLSARCTEGGLVKFNPKGVTILMGVTTLTMASPPRFADQH